MNRRKIGDDAQRWIADLEESPIAARAFKARGNAPDCLVG